MNGAMGGAMGRARQMASGFTPGQRGVVAVAVVALVMGAVALSSWAARPTWTPLYSQLSGSDASAIVEELRAQNVEYQLADGGGTVMVPQSQVYDLRVSLAGKGLPTNSDGSGWDIVAEQGMTTTDFQQNVAYERALEGELAKTVGAITGVRTAVVNLAIPKKDVFADEASAPTAAVLVQLVPGTALSKTQVRSITNLVAGSVPELSADKVTVSDGSGALLTSPDGAPGGTGEAASVANDTDQQTALFEDRMSTNLQQMLDKVLGPGKAVVQVSADLDYDTRETTREVYLAAPTVTPLSEAISRELYGPGAAGAGGQLGVISPTLTPYTPGQQRDGDYLKEERTVNNALGKELSTEKAAPGGTNRLSIAVVLDANTLGATDPTVVQQLVASAAGVDAARGDVVKVDKLPFDTAATEQAKKELEEAVAAERTAQYIEIGERAGLVLLAVVIGIVLMIRRRKAAKDASVEASVSDLPDGVLMPARLEALAAERLQALTAAPIEEDDGSGRALGRDQLRNEVASYVDTQPEEIAQLVQGWLGQRSS